MRGVHQGSRCFTLQSGQSDVEARPDDINAAGPGQVDFGVDRFVPVPAVPGDESLTSSRPSELREVPSRPPDVWALPV